MTNLRDHILAWLDSIGADGVMRNGVLSIAKDNINNTCNFYYDLVPAFRHADGTYHAGPEGAPAAVPSADDFHMTPPDQNGYHGIWNGSTKCIVEGLTFCDAKKVLEVIAAQRQAGREEERAIVEELRHDDIAFIEERYSALEEAAKLAKETLEYVKKYVEGQGLSAEDDCAEAVESINKALSDLGEARKG